MFTVLVVHSCISFTKSSFSGTEVVQMHILQLTNDHPRIILNNEDRAIKQYRVTGQQNNESTEQPDNKVTVNRATGQQYGETAG